MKPLRSLLLCVGVGLLAACNVPAGSSEQEWSLAQSEFADTLEPGEKNQGQQLHGSTPLVDQVAFSSVFMGTQPLSNLRIEKGGLAADRRLSVTGTTASLNACASTSWGVTRSCGFVSKGAGSCVPGTGVTLGGGACGLGTCTGDAVMRVCSGTQPCEYGTPEVLGSADDSCASLCPSVTFTCPASGTYNILAGPYNTSQAWSLEPDPSSGLIGHETLRGAALTGARLQGVQQTTTGPQSIQLYLSDIINANGEPDPDSPPGVQNFWDSSGDTWLYQLQYLLPGSNRLANLCGADGSRPYAVPVQGLYPLGAKGAYSDSTTAFTFGCNSGVIAKCYRWGYKPWKDGPGETRMRHGHASCTRMARADYCGEGKTYTQDGTRIAPWDRYSPVINSMPSSFAQDMEFEAGWSPNGAECLSHWRWQTKQASCAQLTPPIYDDGGVVINRCTGPTEKKLQDGGACASLCDSAEEVQKVFPNVVYEMNRSLRNGMDGGVPDAGP